MRLTAAKEDVLEKLAIKMPSTIVYRDVKTIITIGNIVKKKILLNVKWSFRWTFILFSYFDKSNVKWQFGHL